MKYKTKVPPTQFKPTRRLSWRIAVALVVLVSGCDRSPKPPVNGSSEGAKEELKEIFDRYRNCDAYADQATIELSYRSGKPPVMASERATIATRFVRPNQIDLEIKRGVNALRLHSDGQQVWTRIVDPATQNLDGQVIQVPAPATITASQIYAATELVNPAQPNEAMSALFGMPLNLEISQLGLLLDDALFRQLLESGEVTRLDNRSVNAVDECERYQVASAAGKYVFWWSPTGKALRRIEYPPELVFGQLPASRQPTQCKFQLDLRDIRFGDQVQAEFAAQPPADSVLVRFFVLPPLAPSSQQLGEIIPEFALETMEGQPISSDQWKGQTIVLCWFQDHPTSRATLPRIQKVKGDLKRLEDKLVFAAICADDDETTSTEELRELTRKLKLDVPVLRDASAVGRDILKITDAPTVVVLDKERRLQFFEVGANPKIRETLAKTLERVLSGQQVGSELKQRMQREQQAYQHQLALARISSEPTVVADVDLPAATEPQKLRKRELWRSTEVASPGNSVLIPSPDQPTQVIILDGTHAVVQIDSTGSVVNRFPLSLAEKAGITRLRTAIDGNADRYFLGFSQLGEQLHLLDDQFKVVFSYPETPRRHTRILDAQLLDIDGDGALEIYVGFADPVGTHRVDLTGKRVWSNRATPSVTSIALRRMANPPYLLITSDQGTLRSLSRSGGEGPPITIPTRTIHQLIASNSGQTRPTQFLGMSLTVDGRLIAVGLSAQLHEGWSYGLPPGTYRSQVDSSHSVDLLEEDAQQWLIVGPEGSIHIVNDDGEFFDFFRMGEPVNGLSAYRTDSEGVLIVSTPSGVFAYSMDR